MNPMLAAPSKVVFPDMDPTEIRRRVLADPSWVVTPKLDGRRALVVKQPDVPFRVFNRDGARAQKPMPPGVVAALRALPFDDYALDGELVTDDAGTARLHVFDLPFMAGYVRQSNPFWSDSTAKPGRYNALSVLAEVFDPEGDVRLVPAAIDGERNLLWSAAVGARIEGLVLKKKDGIYQPGRRPRTQVKVKFTKTVDCVVRGLCIDGKDNMDLGMWDPETGQLENIGEVSRLTGDGPSIRVGDVVEVTVLGASPPSKKQPYGRLVQPVTPRFRDDKPGRWCTVDQLDEIRINKEPLEVPA